MDGFWNFGILDHWIIGWNSLDGWLTSVWWNDIMFWHAGNGGNQYWIKKWIMEYCGGGDRGALFMLLRRGSVGLFSTNHGNCDHMVV